MKLEMGIGWVTDEENPGGLRSANPGEYAAEIERLRAALELIAGATTDQLQAMQARCALDNIGANVLQQSVKVTSETKDG